MSHKKLVVSIFLSLLCFLVSMTSAWADNGESDHRYEVEDNAPAEAYEGEYAPENSYPAQEYYQESQGDQGDQGSSPENQGSYSDQGSSPENQESYSDQGSSPENQESYSDSDYYPEKESYSDSDYYPEKGYYEDDEEVSENESLNIDERSWETGYDLRFHLGMSGFYRDIGSSRRYMEGGIGGYLGGEIGYRWKYGGIYIKAGMVALGKAGVDPEIDASKSPSVFLETALLGKFYIPLVDTWELVLNFGVTLAHGANAGAGANYHIGDMTLGFEFTYQHIDATYESAYVNGHLFMLTFVIGYTY